MDTCESAFEARQVRQELLTSPEAQRLAIPDIVPVYQQAFAGEPWFEVSRCGGCERGFSGQPPGEVCRDCATVLTEPAYPTEGLTVRLTEAVEAGTAALYTERGSDGKVLLAALAFDTTPEQIYRDYYADRPPEMGEWLVQSLPDRLIWLAEVFADRRKRPQGNLRDFRSMCEQLAENLGSSVIAYRSINPRIIAKAVTAFGERCVVFEPESQVPDRRSFVLLGVAEAS